METKIKEMEAQMASQKKEMESQRKDMEAKRVKEMDQLRTEIKVLQQEKIERNIIFNIGQKCANEAIN